MTSENPNGHFFAGRIYYKCCKKAGCAVLLAALKYHNGSLVTRIDFLKWVTTGGDPQGGKGYSIVVSL